MRPELTKAIELLQRDTPEGVEEAISLLQNTVYSFSMKVCGHPEDAEDTTQEVLLRSLKHLSRIQEPRALAVWLYTVTRNRCWRMRKKPANRSARHVSLDELMPDESELAALLQDQSATPEGTAAKAEEHETLRRAVLQVPASLRLVLVLHDMEELSTDEVAQVLGLQPGTVRVRLHRARLAVRKEMNRLMQERQPARIGAGARVRRSKPIRSSSTKRPAGCRDLFSQLSEYLDGRVEPSTCEEMQRHIEDCPSCVAFLRDLRNAVERCRSLQANCDPAVAKRLRSVLMNEYVRLLGACPP